MRVSAYTSVFRRYVRVFLDGVEIPDSDCFLADEEEGLVGLYLRNDKGFKYLVDGGAAKEIKHGAVTISLRDDAPDFIRGAFKVLHAPV